jgi:hypothetical protein
MSAVKRVEFVSDRMSCIILKGCWCHIIVLNIHAPTEDKTDDVEGSFYEELERVFNKFPKYHEHFVRRFQCQSRQGSHSLTVGNESLHEISNAKGVRLVNFAISKNLGVKNTMFPHCNIHKYQSC